MVGFIPISRKICRYFDLKTYQIPFYQEQSGLYLRLTHLSVFCQPGAQPNVHVPSTGLQFEESRQFPHFKEHFKPYRPYMHAK